MIDRRANRTLCRDDLSSRRLHAWQGRSAFSLAIAVVDWLPTGCALLMGDDTVGVLTSGQFIGVLERQGGQWGWQEL